MTRLIVTTGFIVSFAAGVVIGLTMDGVRRTTAASEVPGVSTEAPPPPGGRGGWLAQQLGLTPEQREQMDAIWSETARRGGREQWSLRAQLRRERDEAIAGLIPESAAGEHQRIIDDYQSRIEAMEAEWRRSFDEAVERTRAILNEEQRQKYEALMSRHGGENSRDRGRSQSWPRPR